MPKIEFIDPAQERKSGQIEFVANSTGSSMGLDHTPSPQHAFLQITHMRIV